MKLGQGKFSEFALETVRDENVNGKNKEKEDIMKAFLQHKVHMLKEEKSRQAASKNPEASRSPQRDEKHSSNEIQTESNIGTARRYSKTFYFQNDLNAAKPEKKSRESLNKLSKTGLSKNVIILESMVEKEETRKGTMTRKGGKKRTLENFSRKHSEFDKSQMHNKNISTVSKTTNQKKVLLESDDEDNAYEMKEIEPLMILAHQNVKPIKYIFNQKYMGEKITDSDKRFLNPRLPNLFKDKKAGQTDQAEDNYPENIQIKKDYEIPALNSSLFPRENKDTSTISHHNVSQNKGKSTFQKL